MIDTGWYTPEEMYQELTDDPTVDSDGLTVIKIEKLLDELVDENVMERRGNLYRLTDVNTGMQYVSNNK